ncbi:HEWD family protein [Halovivax gelatinilyticus]|uniref:HEWD family protein n=1 Tax=Halovivax gelatinilyticus TaxID=2961597 RepID=UPI0020CA5C78|nr:HEWD family protein [Halovivax gelatinilyticus]
MSKADTSISIRTPEARRCERCGRIERWNQQRAGWELNNHDGRRQIGSPQCIHEWNITGNFSP